MKNILIVVDMQNDFIDGALGICRPSGAANVAIPAAGRGAA